MVSSNGSARVRRCRSAELGVAEPGDGAGWPPGEVVLAAIGEPPGARYVLAIPGAALGGPALTAFLARVAPFGCPIPGSLIRAYGLPDSPFPSILLREHETGADGVGDAYLRFADRPRRDWLAALADAGAGLCPAVAWQAGPARRFLAPGDCTDALAAAGVAFAGVADGYLGRGLLLMAHPGLAGSWPTMMSLGGVTKSRKITGREFPLWVDLPAHQPDLLRSPLLAAAERLLAES